VVYKDIFKEGSLLVTDYSSTAFDFAYLKKPVVYCQFDVDEIYSAHTYKKGYFDYEENGLGEVVYTEEDLVSKIICNINNNCQMMPVYEDRVNRFFAYHDKSNCERILNAITKKQF
jgi:CDP-glycerol glycerophosphotransferase (TagB/SpsB family)